MIKKLKGRVFRAICSFYRYRLLQKGVVAPSSCIINKMPYVRKHKGSKIILGEHVTLTSNRRANPLTEHPVSLRTLNPDATIIMKDNSGMSGSSIVCANKVVIGEYTIIGANTLIYDSDGHTFNQERGWHSDRLKTGRPINIGSKCFIGTRCIILGGVTIGDCCIISAGSVVTQDVPSGHKVYGNPAVCEPLPKALGGGHCHVVNIDAAAISSESKEEVDTSDESTVFLIALKDILEIDFVPGMDDKFRDYPTWDSVSFLSVLAWLQDDFGHILTSEQFNNIVTWRDLYSMLKGEKAE